MMSRIYPLISVIAAIALFVGYVGPTWNGSIAGTKNAIASDDQALAAAQAYATEESQLVSERDAMNPADIARLTTLLPDSVDNVSIILDLDALAARSGLTLSNVNVSAPAASSASAGAPAGLSTGGTGGIGSVDLVVSATGSYAAFQKFLRGVELSERLLDVRQLSVKGSDTGIYIYQMSLRLYWLR
ncbi:MAG TPA: hypothetical protein VMV50_01290 [Candidatus Paceibacterota bacterium]|nr:hypothetical protein [Candidatus Paceibacterota bacterium]